MSIYGIDIEEFTKNFRVSFDKAGLVIYVTPREGISILTRGNTYRFNNEDVQLYGTKVILHLPCSGVIYGRYLISNGDYIEGLYVVINDMECDIVISWYEEGINTEMQVRSNEALLIIIKLMRLRSRKVRPDGHALRIMRALNLSGKLLYSDANHEVQIFGVEKGFVLQSQGNCAYDFVIKQWRLILNKCGFMTEVLTNTDSIVLLISGTDSIIITRHYPSLNKWYELGEVSGFNNYLVIFKGLDSSAL